ncbi:MAG TPA: amidohydrolase [Solirubrobacter sp.]|nr:amidohydrolase [Solirubrobacter sp.]
MSADTAILGARVVTLDPRRPEATAVAWRSGTIVAVGDDASVRAACDARTELIDARGAVVTPGLVDAHIHPFHVEETRGADLTRCSTLAEVNAQLARERGNGWVLGWGLEYGVFGPDAIRGEQLAGEAPTLLTFMDGHTAVASPAALTAAGVTGAEPFAESAAIVVDERGPTGELRELAAIDRVRGVVPALTEAEHRARVVAILRALNAHGITGAHAMTGDPPTFDLLRELEDADELSVRLIVPLWQKPETPWESMLEQVRLRGEHGRLWRGGTAKFFIDGVIDSGTAWLFEPDALGAGTDPFWPDPDRYAAAVALFSEHGFQCATHAVGDRAVAAALDAYRAAPPGPMHRIEHLETVRPQELGRLAAEGVAASMQPLHMQWRADDGGDSWSRRLGPDRRARAFPTRSLLDRGTLLVLGSDWPVATYDPRVGMCWARFRTAPDGAAGPFEREQCLTGDEALRGYTANVAALVGERDRAGMLRAGYRADLTGFGDDPRALGPADLLDVPIVLTVVDGKVVHQE